jgi:membrane fusion protein, multidrug efflux system
VNDADLQAQLAKANAALALAQQREARQKGLLDKEAISREDYESSLRDLQVAAADVALFSAQIAKAEVRTPFAGRLGLRLVSEGAYVTPGTAITTLVNDRPLKVDFSVPQKYAGRIRPSDPLLLTADNRARTYHATVYAIDPMIDESTRSLRVRAVCSDPDQALVPGAFTQVTLELGQDSAAIMVSSSALVPDAAGQKVFCVKGGLATAVAVTIGVRDSSRVQVLAGLQAGDTVITRGVLLVRPGAAVQVTGLE